MAKKIAVLMFTLLFTVLCFTGCTVGAKLGTRFPILQKLDTVGIHFFSPQDTSIPMIMEGGETQTPVTGVDSIDTSDAGKLFKTDKTASLPLMKTDIDSVYYTMSTAGEVLFYQIEGTSVKALEETGVYDVSVRLSGQNVPVVIHYITVNGKTNGFGLYTYNSASGVMMYDYAFFKICELPAKFARDGYLLMLVDVDKTRFYTDKIYSEEFYFDTSDLSTSYFLSEEQRQMGYDGIKMTDYKMFTDDILDQPYGSVYFFTSRAYIADDEKLVDIYTSGGSDTNVDNIRVVRNVIGMYFYRSDAGVYYLNKEDYGFSVYLLSGETYTLKKECTGDYETGYLRSGSAVLNKSTGEIYDIATGTDYTVSLAELGTGFVPSKFVMNGQNAVIFGTDAAGNDAIGIFRASDGKLTVADDVSIKNMLTADITDSGILVISECIASDYSAYQLLYDIAQ